MPGRLKLTRRRHKYSAVACYVRERGAFDVNSELIQATELRRFPSIREAKRYIALRFDETRGRIRSLQCQVPFVIGKIGKRAKRYFADFVYVDCRTGGHVVEDAKGVKTRAYQQAKRAMRELHGVEILET